jgi:hypothetical protein
LTTHAFGDTAGRDPDVSIPARKKNSFTPKATLSLCFHVLLWIRSLALALEAILSMQISSILDDLPAPQRSRGDAKPRRQQHVFLRKCDANYTHSLSRTATPTTRVPAPVAVPARYVMVRPLLGVGCPAAVGFVNRVIVNPGAKSPGRMMAARRNSIGDLTR